MFELQLLEKRATEIRRTFCRSAAKPLYGKPATTYVWLMMNVATQHDQPGEMTMSAILKNKSLLLLIAGFAVLVAVGVLTS